MRPIRRRHFRRRPRRFRFRPRGFSDRFAGPIYRGAFELLGVPPEQRRSAYNLIAIAAVLVVGLGMGVSSLGSGGISGAISALVGGLAIGWFVVTALRYFR
jgi:membrane associated rhomboid family serine protease